MTQNQQSQGRISRYTCCLSALHTLPNMWHLLSGSHVPRASHTFYLCVFMLVIKYKMLKFPEQSRGKWLHLDLHGENTDEPTLHEEQYSHGREQRELPGWREGQQHIVLWGQSTDPTAALLCILSWHHPESTIISGVVAVSSYVKKWWCSHLAIFLDGFWHIWIFLLFFLPAPRHRE